MSSLSPASLVCRLFNPGTSPIAVPEPKRSDLLTRPGSLNRASGLLGRQLRRAVFAGFGIIVASSGFSQASIGLYGVSKGRDYLQSSSATPVSDTITGAFHFSVDLVGSNLNLLTPAPKLTLPNSSQQSLTGNSGSMGISARYASKAGLDAAYPNGSYSLTAETYTLPISFGTGDSYPADIPKIINETWDGQGRLVLNAQSGAELSFNTFSQYSTGVSEWISFNLYAVSGTTLGNELASVERVALSGYTSDAALTSYAIPANFLLADRTYYAELSFARIVNLNTSALPIVGTATFLYTTGFMISTAVPAAAPNFTAQPASHAVTVGSNVTLNVTASGNPAPVFQWRKDGVAITGATLASFTLNNVQLPDAGSYTVVASNSAGIATSEVAVLTVNPVPVAPTITLQPVSQTVVAGMSVTFTASATGIPEPAFQWQKDGLDFIGATHSTLTINSVQPSDAGTYVLLATNSVGTASSSSANLTVNSVPAFTTHPLSQTVAAGSPVTFTASATGHPSPTFQWQKNGAQIAGATSASYTISYAAADDEGAYTVIATNAVGTATSAAALLLVPAIIAPTNAIVTFTIE